jgi:hypothetical protein
MTSSTKIQWPRGTRISAEALRLFLSYEPSSGEFLWLVSRRGPGAKAGCEAGRIDGHGYRRIKIAGVEYAAHRLAWLHMTGKWPDNEVDHINGARLDNRWANLRDVSTAVNQHNRRGAGRNNPHGLLGVSVGYGGRFRAGIKFDGRNRHLGTYDTKEQAHSAYVQAKRQFHEGSTL